MPGHQGGREDAAGQQRHDQLAHHIGRVLCAVERAVEPLLPWFAVAFVGLVIVNSLTVLPAWLVDAGNTLCREFLVAAMAAIGMKTHLKDILSVGWKPVILVLLETLFLAGLFYGLLRLMAAQG